MIRRSSTPGTPTLTTLLKIFEVRAETEELDVQKQNAEDDDTQDPHHRHLEEASLRRLLMNSVKKP